MHCFRESKGYQSHLQSKELHYLLSPLYLSESWFIVVHLSDCYLWRWDTINLYKERMANSKPKAWFTEFRDWFASSLLKSKAWFTEFRDWFASLIIATIVLYSLIISSFIFLRITLQVHWYCFPVNYSSATLIHLHLLILILTLLRSGLESISD